MCCCTAQGDGELMTQGSPTSAESDDGEPADAFESIWRVAALQRQVTLARTTCLATTARFSPAATHPGFGIYAVLHGLE